MILAIRPSRMKKEKRIKTASLIHRFILNNELAEALLRDKPIVKNQRVGAPRKSCPTILLPTR